MRHIIDFGSRAAKFYVCDGVAYDIDMHESRYHIVGVYWFLYPPNDGPPAMIEHDEWIYAYPPERPPIYYCQWEHGGRTILVSPYI